MLTGGSNVWGEQRVKPAQVWVGAPRPHLALVSWQILMSFMVLLQPQLPPWLPPATQHSPLHVAPSVLAGSRQGKMQLGA